VDPLVPCFSTARSAKLLPLCSESPPGGPRPSAHIRARTRACACPAPLTSGPVLIVAPLVRQQRPGIPSLTPCPAQAAGPWDPRVRHPRPRTHPLVLISTLIRDPTTKEIRYPFDLMFYKENPQFSGIRTHRPYFFQPSP
jgi:hypothetical protein